MAVMLIRPPAEADSLASFAFGPPVRLRTLTPIRTTSTVRVFA